MAETTNSRVTLWNLSQKYVLEIFHPPEAEPGKAPFAAHSPRRMSKESNEAWRTKAPKKRNRYF